ncbi:MAG: hypothetical protein WC996_08575 [Peptostreptococcales bacterium]
MSLFENIIVFCVTGFMFFLIFVRIKSFIKNPSDIVGRAGRNIVEAIYITVILVLCFLHIKALIDYRNTSVWVGSYYKQIMMIVAIFLLWTSFTVKRHQKKMAAIAHMERMAQQYQDDYDDDYDDFDDDEEDEFEKLVDEDVDDEDVEDEDVWGEAEDMEDRDEDLEDEIPSIDEGEKE